MSDIGTVLEGDCRTIMAEMAADSIDAIVCDPPYELVNPRKGKPQGADRVMVENPYGRHRVGTRGFMGKEWDGTGVAFDIATWSEAFRVAKPGAHLLAFGGTRTVHRMTCAIEDAGWEIRDMLCWAYASGFPKSSNPGKVHDAAECRARGMHTDERDHLCQPVAPEGWYGMGTALKPAWEPIVMARKPTRGSVARNMAEYGTGALNIDPTRLPIAEDDEINTAVWTARPSAFRDGTTGFMTSNSDGDRIPARPTTARRPAKVDPDSPAGFGKGAAMGGEGSPLGRWPANLLLTDPIFDGGIEGVVGGGSQKSAFAKAGGTISATDGTVYEARPDGVRYRDTYGDAGTYSRFFLIPKADRNDREPVLRGSLAATDGVEAATPKASIKMCRNCGSKRLGDGGVHICRDGCPEKDLILTPPEVSARENTHPTVKPSELMRHLVRLVTPPGGLVLDPFLGSGTTAIAAEQEGMRWVGIELDAQHVQIVRARLLGTQRGLGL